MARVKALILAGGKGTRLRPITYEIPKPLVPVGGKPIVQHLIENLKAYGITDIILSVGYLADKIRDYFGDGGRFGVKISYLVEKEELGTGGPLHLAESMLTDTFLVINGDGLFKNMNVGKLLETHRRNRALVTLTLAKVDDPSRFGVVVMEGERVARFVEKPKKEEAPSNLVNAGFYCADKELLRRVPKGFCKIEQSIFPQIAAEGRMFGYVMEDGWTDIGTLEDYEKVVRLG